MQGVGLSIFLATIIEFRNGSGAIATWWIISVPLSYSKPHSSCRWNKRELP